jgi:hypothetical protein
MRRAAVCYVVHMSSRLTPFAPSAAPIKRTAVEKQVNTQIVYLFGLLLALSVGSTIGASIQMVCWTDSLAIILTMAEHTFRSGSMRKANGTF